MCLPTALGEVEQFYSKRYQFYTNLALAEEQAV